MEVIGGFAVHTALVLALLILIELLEAIFGVGIILDVVTLVLLNVTLVLEGECAAWAPAVEVCSLLPVELTPDCATVLSCTESLEAIVDQLGILFMEVFMGHDV